MRLFQVSLIVRDYDEAIRFYVDKLGFDLLEDTVLTETKRWVRVGSPDNGAACLLLARAASEEQMKSVGNQTGGRVFLFLETDNIQEAITRCEQNGIQIVQSLRDEPYGKVIVIEDLYGNKIDVIQPVVR
ncbi:MAG: VOC family protein [Bacteroidia bacterium]|nr:VOC family protein [Bacteroidia bacterium]